MKKRPNFAWESEEIDLKKKNIVAKLKIFHKGIWLKNKKDRTPIDPWRFGPKALAIHWVIPERSHKTRSQNHIGTNCYFCSNVWEGYECLSFLCILMTFEKKALEVYFCLPNLQTFTWSLSRGNNLSLHLIVQYWEKKVLHVHVSKENNHNRDLKQTNMFEKCIREKEQYFCFVFFSPNVSIFLFQSIFTLKGNPFYALIST